ncbi:Uma2 family endonuclease, partial [Thermus altitudinis]|uniref:Uma2 family endonuclease n=1 Tax=Thermus altitudinis TaxID=2908145 RepID=UPI001FA94227
MLAPRLPVTLEAYLQEEARSPVKREYLRGRVYAMAGASALHNRVALNIAARLLEAARTKGCRVYMSDMKLRIRDEAVYYPDVMVVCQPGPPHPYYEEAPCAVVEVLSPATEAQDRREKRALYRKRGVRGAIMPRTFSPGIHGPPTVGYTRSKWSSGVTP